jgi:taurine dioxygenase
VPPYGGDTLFASQYLAWESLSEGMRAMLRPLRCINSPAKADVSRTHPQTGRIALYVNIAPALRLDGMKGWPCAIAICCRRCPGRRILWPRGGFLS